MEEIAAALSAFFGGFGLAAYPEDGVPEAGDGGYEGAATDAAVSQAAKPFGIGTGHSPARLPYITYPLVKPEWDAPAAVQVRVWAHDEGYAFVTGKADEIVAAIGEGVLLPAGEGYVCLRPGNPRVQMEDSGERQLKAACVSMMLSAYTL